MHGALITLALSVPWVVAAETRPNVVLILVDDLGYGELGCQGNPEIPTPNIDSIAAQGVRFTAGYVTAAFRSPSRAGLLTGRIQDRFGVPLPADRPFDGQNLLPYLSAAEPDRPRAILLASDVSEAHDLALDRVEILDALADVWEGLDAEMAMPPDLTAHAPQPVQLPGGRRGGRVAVRSQ